MKLKKTNKSSFRSCLKKGKWDLAMYHLDNNSNGSCYGVSVLRFIELLRLVVIIPEGRDYIIVKRFEMTTS